MAPSYFPFPLSSSFSKISEVFVPFFLLLFLGLVGHRVVVADGLGERGIDPAHQVFHGDELAALGLQPLDPLLSVG